ncbi:MAG: hypothetical protein QW165_05275 [Candidatus Woesearchaeota archaeon]
MSVARAVKQTLCGIVLSAGISTLTTCTTAPITVPHHQVEQKTDKVVQQAIDYFVNKEHAKAQGLLEQRWDYLCEEYRANLQAIQKTNPGIQIASPELTPSENAMLALSYAMNGHYDKAETRFTMLMTQFKSRPTATVEDVRTNLDELFASEQYTRAENMAISGTIFYSRMNAVVGFLKFARKDYCGARNYFKKAIPFFDEGTVNEYRIAFNVLLAEASIKGADDNTILEYARTVHAVHSVKGKEEKINK